MKGQQALKLGFGSLLLAGCFGAALEQSIHCVEHCGTSTSVELPGGAETSDASTSTSDSSGSGSASTSLGTVGSVELTGTSDTTSSTEGLTSGESVETTEASSDEMCSNQPMSLERHMFVTPEKYKGDLSPNGWNWNDLIVPWSDTMSAVDVSGGLRGDYLCNCAAAAQGFGHGRYVAWLSDDNGEIVNLLESEKYQFDTSAVHFVRAGSPHDCIARSWDMLIGEGLVGAVADGIDDPVEAWTGRDGEDCANWDSDDFGTRGVYGAANSAQSEEWRGDQDGDCSDARHLYCVQVDDVPVEIARDACPG